MGEGRIRLAPLLPQDSATMFDWINDREQILWSAPYKPVHAANHQKWFESLQNRADFRIFAIRPVDSDALLGTCQLHSISPVNRNAELQIRLGETTCRASGIGTEAVSKLVAHGFRDLNLHRIYLYVFATNAAAIRAYEKVGFVREGVQREAAFIDGRYVDIIIMGLLVSEFADPEGLPQ